MANIMNIDLIVKMSKGNPGAAIALSELMQIRPDTVEKINNYGIHGTDVYVLYSDLCGRNPFKAADLVDNCPEEILIDACSRQDYSGRELVAPYVK